MCGKAKYTFSILFTAIRSFSTDFIIAFFGGTGDWATDSSLLSTNDLFRLLLVIALLDVFLVTGGGCLFVDAKDDDDEKLSAANVVGGDVEVLSPL